MSQLRLSVVSAAACCAALAGSAAVAQAAVPVEVSRVTTRTERPHPAVNQERVVATVCVRAVETSQRHVTATLRANFLLVPRRGHDRGSKGFTLPIEMSARHRGETCESRAVAGVVEDVQRRLRFTTEDGGGVVWRGPDKVGPGYRAG
jgi:hypothetical protein